MYTVYVLKDINGHFYKGVTNDIIRRLREHRSGNTVTTSKMVDIKVVYTEVYDNFSEARKREVYFKTASGRRFLKKVIIMPI
jgi:putative endonuclease